MEQDAPNAALMRIAQASVITERSSRYLAQLCEHINHAAKQHGAQVERSDDRGTATFGWGSCTFSAEPGVLLLRAEATDEQGLQRLTDLLSTLLVRIGRRDHLTVTWTPVHHAGA